MARDPTRPEDGVEGFEGVFVMQTTTIGVDFAKHVFPSATLGGWKLALRCGGAS